jgi:hypothetical protein
MFEGIVTVVPDVMVCCNVMPEGVVEICCGE